MKTYIYKAVAGVCSLMLLMSSCESFLSEEPKDFLSPENLPNTEAECNMLLMGSLSYWRSNNFERHINFIAEATTDAVVSATANNVARDEMNSLTWQSDNESLYKPWQQFYACINASNIMIEMRSRHVMSQLPVICVRCPISIWCVSLMMLFIWTRR